MHGLEKCVNRQKVYCNTGSSGGAENHTPCLLRQIKEGVFLHIKTKDCVDQNDRVHRSFKGQGPIER